MARYEWEALPEGVRAAVERRAGPVLKYEPAPAGTACGFAGALHPADGTVFCKGVRTANRTACETVLDLWEHKSRMAPRPHSARLTAVARVWAQHRLEGS